MLFSQVYRCILFNSFIQKYRIKPFLFPLFVEDLQMALIQLKVPDTVTLPSIFHVQNYLFQLLSDVSGLFYKQLFFPITLLNLPKQLTKTKLSIHWFVIMIVWNVLMCAALALIELKAAVRIRVKLPKKARVDLYIRAKTTTYTKYQKSKSSKSTKSCGFV